MYTKGVLGVAKDKVHCQSSDATYQGSTGGITMGKADWHARDTTYKGSTAEATKVKVNYPGMLHTKVSLLK